MVVGVTNICKNFVSLLERKLTVPICLHDGTLVATKSHDVRFFDESLSLRVKGTSMELIDTPRHQELADDLCSELPSIVCQDSICSVVLLDHFLNEKVNIIALLVRKKLSHQEFGMVISHGKIVPDTNLFEINNPLTKTIQNMTG